MVKELTEESLSSHNPFQVAFIILMSRLWHEGELSELIMDPPGRKKEGEDAYSSWGPLKKGDRERGSQAHDMHDCPSVVMTGVLRILTI